MIQNINQFGAVMLFLGTETANWSTDQFKQASANAKALGVSALLVKIADGGNVWYGGNWKAVLDAVNGAGLVAVPYTYSYGNKFGAIQAEINILIAAMQYAGVAVADCETEWNGHADWAQTMCAALKPIPGLFGVTTLADPNQQNWQGVLSALKPCVNFWLPQVYSDFLASVYHAQYDPYGLPYFPVLNLGTDFGPNNILATAQNSHSPVVALWWYEAAIGGYSGIVKSIVSLFHQPSIADLEAQIAAQTAQIAKLTAALQIVYSAAKPFQP